MTFEQAYERHYAELLAYARRLDPEHAEDLVQDVFVRLMTAGYVERGQLRAWLYKVLKCRIIDVRRYDRRRPRAALTPNSAVETARDDAIIQAIEVARIWKQVASLYPAWASVLWMRFGADLSLDEVAGRKGLTRDAVKALQHRALTALRSELA